MKRSVDFEPITQMWKRVHRAYEDSDASAFDKVMEAGEFFIKLACCGLVAAIQNDPQRNRYRLAHNLVRASGLGEWSAALDEIFNGPPSQFLLPEARVEVRELTQKVAVGEWQFEVAYGINKCLRQVRPETEALPQKVACRYAINEFITLRNKTRGHGAPSLTMKASMVKELEDSLRTFVYNFGLFRRPWAFLYRNLSGKYRVTALNSDGSPHFERLKTHTSFVHPNGVYIAFDEIAQVELMHSDPEASDFYVANGNFTAQKFEMLSYLSGSTHFADPKQYLAPATPLPSSHTSGKENLDLAYVDKALTNLPPLATKYIPRPELEQEVEKAIKSSFPIVTLVGKGGIGKTSLALAMLHKQKLSDNFEAILWFSARDIDLLPEGPKNVKPDVLDERDIAREFVKLIDPSEKSEKGFDALQFFQYSLEASPTDAPYIFVFDNFETVKNPVELFNWLATYIRHPNKIFITTRFRDFNGDWKITVTGMSTEEAQELVRQTSIELGISQELSTRYIDELIKESDGHPYVIKMLLGEAARSRNFNKVERILAGQDEILTALFERTYSNLTPIARRIFLTLCYWRSSIPEIALEAVIMRSSEERVDVQAAISELDQSSLVELFESELDDTRYVSVPLVAHVFGGKKLAVSPIKTKIEIDRDILMDFGAMQESDVQYGLQPRIQRLIQNIAKRADRGQAVSDYDDILAFIGRRFTPAWLHIASLYEERGNIEAAKFALQQYLENSISDDERRRAWERLANLFKKSRAYESELHALAEIAKTPNIWYVKLSEVALRVNEILNEMSKPMNRDINKEEKEQLVGRLIVLMQERIDEATSVDHSRIAWLMLNINDSEGAKHVVKSGLHKDPSDFHCNRLANRLAI